MGAVAVEVTNSSDGAAMTPDVDAAGPLAVYKLPLVSLLGAWIVPKHIAEAIMIEVTNAADLIPGRMVTGIDAPGPLTVHQHPDIRFASCLVVEEDVAISVVIEVADAANLPAGSRMLAGVCACRPFSV